MALFRPALFAGLRSGSDLASCDAGAAGRIAPAFPLFFGAGSAFDLAVEALWVDFGLGLRLGNGVGTGAGAGSSPFSPTNRDTRSSTPPELD